MKNTKKHKDLEIPYHKCCPIDTPPEVRKKHYVGNIFENRAKCLKCGDVIISRNVHDYVTCSCGDLSVDGGSWYAKRSCASLNNYEELSTYYANLHK